jgi:PAS domain S-box-containing protein
MKLDTFKAVEIELDNSLESLIVRNSFDYAMFTFSPQGKITSWNRGAERLFGWRASELLNHPVSKLCTLEDIQIGKLSSEIDLVLRKGWIEDEGWRSRKDGSRFWGSGTLSLLYDSKGEIIGFSRILRDLTEKHQAEAQKIGLLRAESNHRIKNILSNIQALAKQTLHSKTEPVAFTNSFLRRLVAYSQTQNLITYSMANSVELKEVLENVMQKQFLKSSLQVTYSRTLVYLNVQAITTFSMVFSELLSNSLDYGALSSPVGHLHITWQKENGLLCLKWSETNVTCLETPTFGLGLRLIKQTVEYELQGKVSLDFSDNHFHCSIEVPQKCCLLKI